LIVLRATAADDVRGEPGAVVATGGAVSVACSPGSIDITELMQEGRAPMATKEFLRGYPLAAGDRLT
jgi:methionyl-tRNA formyltransferase